MQTIVRIAIAILFLAAPQALASKRVGFVVGINAYTSLSADKQLRTAVSDSETIARTLRDIGFDHVEHAKDTSGDEFIQKFSVFLSRIEPGDTAFFFYAGHGIGMKTGNFLLPGDIPPIESWSDLTLERTAISEAYVIEKIQARGARLAVLVIDACRNSPFGDTTRSLTRDLGMQSRGLVEPVKAVGVFTIYSAGIGQRALDRLSDSETIQNSVFTRVFAEKLRQSDIHLADLAVDVRETVAELAASVIDPDTRQPHQQNVAYYDQTRGGRIFLGGSSGSAAPSVRLEQAAPVTQTPQQTVPVTGSLASDFELARSIGSPEAWEAFVERHGSEDDLRVSLARKELARQGAKIGQQAAPLGGQSLALLNRLPDVTLDPEQAKADCELAAGANSSNFASLQKTDLTKVERDCRASLASAPNDPYRLYLLARVLTARNGSEVNTDQAPAAEAAQLFQKAAGLGYAQAASAMAYLHIYGLGNLEKSDALALEWYRKAAELGDGQGMAGVGMMYEEGRAGLQKDFAQSVSWYRKSAATGDGYGMQRLGIAYAYGEGVPKDDATAFHWYIKAEAAGETEVANNLAYAYANGSGTSKDPGEAARWFMQAVKLGTTWSQSQIGTDEMNAFGSDSIREMQRTLKDAGHYSGPLDGAFGPKMKAAFEAYAKAG